MSIRKTKRDEELLGKIQGGSSRFVKAGDLELYPENPNRGNVEEIRVSIRENGFWGVLVVQKSRMRIAIGNHRFQAGQKEGMTTFPCQVCDLTDDETRELLLADNRLGEMGTYDQPRLLAALEAVQKKKGSLRGTGFRERDLDRLRANLEESESEIEFSPEILEEHQYLVLYFDNSVDWRGALDVFGVETVKAWDSRPGYQREGRGRVISGAKVLRMLQKAAGDDPDE